MTLITLKLIGVLLLLQLQLVKTQDANISIQNDSKGKLDFVGLAAKSGYTAESFDVITEDGYILKLFHIPGNKSHPVFLMHGLVDSADAFILRANTSLAAAFANKNRDVWAGNFRGNKYSRRHLTLDPDRDKNFWNYTFHEIALYDITAMIDFVLNKTNQQQLSYIGCSEGTTFAYTLGAVKPEYNAKIKIMISLAPICYLENIRGATAPLLPIAPGISAVFEALGINELLADNSSISTVLEILCTNNTPGYVFCNGLTRSAIYGPDPNQIEPDFSDNIFQSYPAGTSRKNVVHLAQSGRTRRFTQYDYGTIGNLEAYKSSSPPAYDLSKVTMKVALIVGKNDYLATVKDTKRLQNELGNVVEYFEVEPDLFNHIDFVWGRDSYKVLYPYIIELVEKYD